jgi:hypothetical protein
MGVVPLFDYGPAWLAFLALLVVAILLRFAAATRRERREERDRTDRRRAYARAAEFPLPPTTDRRAPRVTAAAPSSRPAEASHA